MSSSPLLTITESHGFRALLAAIISVFAAIRLLGRGLRNLACRFTQPAEPEASPTFWARVLPGEVAGARRVPVLWFDTSGGREGPVIRGLAPQPLLDYCSLYNSPARPLVEQSVAAGRGWSGFRT
jgi:hypothetical protein